MKPLFFSTAMPELIENDWEKLGQLCKPKEIEGNLTCFGDITFLKFDEPGTITICGETINVSIGIYAIPLMFKVYSSFCVSKCTRIAKWVTDEVGKHLQHLVNIPIYQKFGDKIVIYQSGICNVLIEGEPLKLPFDNPQYYHKLERTGIFTLDIRSKKIGTIENIYDQCENCNQIDSFGEMKQCQLGFWGGPFESYFKIKTRQPTKVLEWIASVDAVSDPFGMHLNVKINEDTIDVTTDEDIEHQRQLFIKKQILYLNPIVDAGILEPLA